MRAFSFCLVLSVVATSGALLSSFCAPRTILANELPDPLAQKASDCLPVWSPFDEPVAPLELNEESSEADQDRGLALALFSAGRAMELRGRASEAIQRYQRSLFYEPSSKTAAEGVVHLAQELGRKDERLRYLVRWAELAPTELPPEVMVDLMDSPKATVSEDRLIKVLQLLVEEREKAELRSPGDLLLYWRLAEMLASRDEFDAAADAATHVVQALQNPESFGLSGELAEQIESQSAEALVQFADLFVDVGRTDEAERLYRKVNVHSPNPRWLHLRLACVEIKRRNGKAALKQLEPVLANPPVEECFAPFTALEAIYKQLGCEAELTEKLLLLREQFPKHVPLLCFLGQHYLEKKDYGRAKEAFLASLKFQPTRTALAGIGEVGLASGDPTAWLGLLAREFEMCGSLTAMSGQVDRVVDNPKLLDQTLQAAERILQKAPDRLGKFGPLTTVVIALRGKRFEKIEPLLPLVKAATPEETIQLLLCWGMLLFEEGRYTEAIKVCHEGLKRSTQKEEYVSLEYFLAGALEMEHETDRAISAIDRAIACDPTSARLLYQRAWILFHAERNEESRRAFEDFLVRTKKVHDVPTTRLLVAESHQVLAHLASLKGDIQQAEEHLLRVLDEFPDDASVKNDLAFLWAESGVNLQKSLRLATQAVRASPEDGTYRDTLGWTYFRLGQIDLAIEELRRAKELNPRDKEISIHLGRVLEFSRKSD